MAALGAALPFATMVAVDRILPRKDMVTLTYVAIGLLVAQVARAFLSLLVSYCATTIARSVQTTIQQDLFRHLLRLPPPFFDAQPSGYLLSRVGEVSAIAVLFSPAVLTPLLGLCEFVVSAIVMSHLSLELTLVVGLLLPVMVTLTRGYGRAVRACTELALEDTAAVSKQIQEALGAVQTIKECGAEDRCADRIARSLRLLCGRSTVLSLTTATSSEVTTTLTAAIGILVLWMAGYTISGGTLTVGGYLAFSIYLGKFMGPAQSLASLGISLQPAFLGLRRFRALSAEEEEDTREPLLRLSQVRGHIAFDRVRFEYASRRGCDVLRGLDLEISPGEHVAIVGPSGSGKTTMIRLLLGFYRPAEGVVRIDGHDIMTLHLGSLRQHIGIVSQHIVLFDDTLLENIRYSNPAATEAAVREAARAADAHAFIERLPLGYATRVGERGATLSGGQRQRIAIARALLKAPDIIVFDEATSQLDGESERRVWRHALDLFRGRTVLIVSHRPAPVAAADRVFVFEEGRVREAGRHHELVERDWRYRGLMSADGLTSLAAPPNAKTVETMGGPDNGRRL